MRVIWLVIRLVEHGLEVFAHPNERIAQHNPYPWRDHRASILGGEDQMGMQAVDNVPSGTKVL
jgi:hypothetical protein